MAKKQGGAGARKHGRKKNRRPGHKRRNEREIRRISKAGGPKNAKERGFAARHGVKVL